MKTDDLINLLSTNVEPVDRRQLRRSLGLAVALGAGGALITVLLALGVRTDLHEPGVLAFLGLKLAFATGVVLMASLLLTRLARPGGEHGTRPILVLLPFAAIALLAGLSLAHTPSTHWEAMIVGDMWLNCLVSIPTIAVVPFAVVVWAVRRFAAPTNLAWTGAFAGLAAGGVSAMGYALHCMDDSLPFIALWYGGTIILCTVAGALLGPRLLRW
ncbi:DUF1109 domain-containing protein [Microvirga sp. Mcv34]|uniref:DUF1109 domain-containing protein n=1 Tax=Microvirga sp. Mcv34 TaxID=2926016 RepID=UPI0021C58FA5|nr:DUF1109 domain-containing protein [Microvirga sp. Mcv34]